MKKKICLLLCLLLLCTLSLPAVAAGSEPKITLQPQNYHYPQYSVAIYTVKAEGQNLHATWYLSYEGKTYNLSDNQNSFEPWEVTPVRTTDLWNKGPIPSAGSSVALRTDSTERKFGVSLKTATMM